MEPWCHSDITYQCIEGLIYHGLLYAWTTTEEWRLPDEEDVLSPPYGYVISFVHFHERGFATPAHRFLRGLLHYYQIEWRHSSPRVRDSWGPIPTLICGGTSSPSPSRRRGRRGRS